MMTLNAAVERRFWSRVAICDGCWLWTGAKTSHGGYGIIRHNRKGLRAHRVSWVLANGCDIPEGVVIMHTCDTPLCVNPTHLLAGTQLENIEDRCQKGRSASGTLNPKSKLTPELVREVRRRSESGEGYRALGREFGLSHTSIRDVVLGMSWGHI